MATSKRIFCDTNFLLDVFDPDRTGHGDALALLWYCAEDPSRAQAIASITSFKDAYYILTRLYKNEQLARSSIEGLMGTFVQPIDMLAEYGAEALICNEPDFEDGLIRICAEHEGATAIITRDTSAFAGCIIPHMTAAEFLDREEFTYAEIDF